MSKGNRKGYVKANVQKVDEIKIAFRKKGIDRTALAYLIGEGNAFFSNIKNWNCKPESLENLARIATKFNIPCTYEELVEIPCEADALPDSEPVADSVVVESVTLDSLKAQLDFIEGQLTLRAIQLDKVLTILEDAKIIKKKRGK